MLKVDFIVSPILREEKILREKLRNIKNSLKILNNFENN